MQAAGGQADGSGEGWCDLNCQVATLVTLSRIQVRGERGNVLTGDGDGGDQGELERREKLALAQN